MESIPVEKLLEDGIALHLGDKLINNKTGFVIPLENPSWAGQSGLDWFNKLKTLEADFNHFKRYSLVSFKERKNETGKQPVPYDIFVEVTTIAEETVVDYTNWFTWEVDCSNPIITWRPDFDFLYDKYNTEAPESDSKPSKPENGTTSHVGVENTPDGVSEAPVYTKEMYDQGILPEVGMTHKKDKIVGVFFRQTESKDTHPQVLVKFDYGGLFCLSTLEFPEPEKTFEEKVVDKLASFWKDTFDNFLGVDDKLLLKIYKEVKRIEKELQDD